MSDESGSTGAEARPRRCRGIGAAWVYLALMIVIGSSTATAAKLALNELPWSLLPLVRFGVAGLILGPIVAGPLRRMLREDGGRLLAAATLCVPVNQTFFLNGTRLSSTSHVGLIYATCPLVVLALTVALGQERLIPGRLMGVFLSVLGVIVIGLGNLLQGGKEGADFLRGDLLLVGAVASWGAYLTVNKRLVAKHGGLTTLAGTLLVGCALDLPIAFLTAADGDWAKVAAASSTAWLGLAHLTLVVSLFGLAFQNLALRHVDASQLAAVGNAAPLLTILWGVWLLGESFTPAIAVGGVLTLAGIAWTNRAAPAPTAVRGRSLAA